MRDIRYHHGGTYLDSRSAVVMYFLRFMIIFITVKGSSVSL